MVPKIHRSGASFRGVTAYCLGDKSVPPPDPEASQEDWDRQYEERKKHLEAKPFFAAGEISERVAWTETRNLDTNDPLQASRRMAATASYSEELKRLAGIRAGGRKLERPVCHYSLSWKEGEQPDQAEMLQAVEGSLKQLKLEDHQTLMVAHKDGKCAHVHVIVNRVSFEDGRAAKLGNSRIELSRWAEQWEKDRQRIQCPRRERNNREREKGMRIVDRKSRKRDVRNHRLPQWKDFKRRRNPRGRDTDEAHTVAKNRVVELRTVQEIKQIHSKTCELMDADQNRDWRELYKRQDDERKAQARKPTSKPADETRPDLSRLAAAASPHSRDDQATGEHNGDAINLALNKPGKTRQEVLHSLAMEVSNSPEERMVGSLAGAAINKTLAHRREEASSRAPQSADPAPSNTKHDLATRHLHERTELAELHKRQAKACLQELQQLYEQTFKQRSQEPVTSRADLQIIVDEVREQGYDPRFSLTMQLQQQQSPSLDR